MLSKVFRTSIVVVLVLCDVELWNIVLRIPPVSREFVQKLVVYSKSAGRKKQIPPVSRVLVPKLVVQTLVDLTPNPL